MRATTSVSTWLAVLAVLAAGCAASPPVPVPIDGMAKASAVVNPDIDGRASPVAVKIYQLRTAGSFESADFFALYGNAAAALGPDLVASTDLTIRPGEQRKFEEEIDPRTRFVGVVAGFRDLQNARWRATVAVPTKGLKDRELDVRVDNLTVDVSFVEPD